MKIHDLPAQTRGRARRLCRHNQHEGSQSNKRLTAVNAQGIPPRSHLGQVSQLRPLPPQLIENAAVEGLLLLTATAQFPQVGIIQTGPVLREGLGTVSLDLPTRSSEKQRLDSQSNKQD